MKKRINCPECGKEMNLMGLRWHRIAKHNIQLESVLIVPLKAPEPSPFYLLKRDRLSNHKDRRWYKNG